MALDKRSVRTEAPSDVQVQIADSVTPTQQAQVDATRRLHVYDERLVSDPLPVVVVDGAAGVTPMAEYAASASLAAQASEIIQSTVIPDTETARWQGVMVSSEAPFQATIRVNDGVTPVVVGVIHGEAGATVQWRPANPSATLYELLGDGVGTFLEVVVLNNGTAAIGPSAVAHVQMEYDLEA